MQMDEQQVHHLFQCRVEVEQHWQMRLERIIHLMDGIQVKLDEQKHEMHEQVIHQVMM
jgi:hypothetical protein